MRARTSSAQDLQVIAHGGGQPLVECFADQRVTDGDFCQSGNRGLECTQVGLAEIVPGIDGESGLLRATRGIGACGQDRGPSTR